MNHIKKQKLMNHWEKSIVKTIESYVNTFDWNICKKNKNTLCKRKKKTPHVNLSMRRFTAQIWHLLKLNYFLLKE